MFDNKFLGIASLMWKKCHKKCPKLKNIICPYNDELRYCCLYYNAKKVVLIKIVVARVCISQIEFFLAKKYTMDLMPVWLCVLFFYARKASFFLITLSASRFKPCTALCMHMHLWFTYMKKAV